MTEQNQESQTGAQGGASSGAQKKLAPADFRVDSFDPRVEGVEPLTQAGTPVAKGKEKQVRDAAERAGVDLREVS